MADKESARSPQGEATPIGLTALIQELGLRVPPPKVRSQVAHAARKTVVRDGVLWESYPPAYRPRDILGHLRFAMRYEPIHLGILSALFHTLPASVIESWIRTDPTSKFLRRAWYLHELLTGQTLDAPDVVPTGYVDLLDQRTHLTADPIFVRRQRIKDNLLGTRAYCPLIRRTETLDQWIAQDLATEGRGIVEGCDPAILARAVNYLFTKETKSSFAIEGEAPSPDRTKRFVAALGQAATFDASDARAFVHLQSLIVDPRYAESSWRTTQNFVSQTLPDYSEQVHFVGPKPEDVPGLMAGWMRMTERLLKSKVDAVAAAAASAFGFVFIHPFIDGNGRIHRFLVHHILARSGFTPEGVLFPVSAVMLRHRRAYDTVLDCGSSSIQPLIDWTFDPSHRMHVRNETAHLYRFFDATPFAEYLYACVADTIRRDLKEELGFLSVFDAAVRKTLDIVDMPNRRASFLVRLILQNQGTLSKAKREEFRELTDEEIENIAAAVRTSMEAQARA